MQLETEDSLQSVYQKALSKFSNLIHTAFLTFSLLLRGNIEMTVTDRGMLKEKKSV